MENEWNHFMKILLLDIYFKINGWIYEGILEVLVKISLYMILFPLIRSNFWGMEIWILRNEYILFYQFHSLSLKLQIRECKKYSKIISLIRFHSLLLNLFDILHPYSISVFVCVCIYIYFDVNESIFIHELNSQINFKLWATVDSIVLTVSSSQVTKSSMHWEYRFLFLFF